MQRQRSITVWCALAVLFALSTTHQVLASTTCVNSVSGLQAALAAAANNNEDDYIKVAAITYAFNSTIQIIVSDGHALTIEGGYANCASATPTPVPDNTVINGTNGTSVYIGSGGGVTIRNLTFTGFKPAAGTNAIEFYAAGQLRIENVAVSGNGVNGINDSILAIYPAGGLIFDDNIVHDNANAYAALAVNAQYPSEPVAIVNNTVTANAGPGLALNVYSETPATLFNNILWNNGAGDLLVTYVNGNMPPLALNNVWLNCVGCATLSLASANNSSDDPKLTTSAPKYRLGVNSPAINSGVPAPLVLPATDAAGKPRVLGSSPDRGAYESSTDDLSGSTYLVTSTGDDANNILTLRGAITAANKAGVPAAIHFHFFSGCPQAIYLSTPLPPITVPMLIDGYSDPNSAPNTASPTATGAIPFNATLCPIVFGSGSPGPANALSVSSSADPSVHLDVRGLRFENFGAAVQLSGGYGHWIHGNAFAGPFIFNTFIGNGIGVQLDGAFAGVIGGPALADVNLIGVSSGTAGVFVTGGVSSVQNWYHTITNNSIGADPSGATNTNYANVNHGIEVQYARQATITANWIVANGGDGIRIDNSTLTLVQTNHIGSIEAAGYGNAGAGVRLLNSASVNWVGTTDPQANDGNGNVIAYNDGAGVLVDLDAGPYNLVTGNSIYNNVGLAIDLALQGPTPNVGDETTGPNHLLHKPQLMSATNAGGGYVTVKGSFFIGYPNDNRYVTIYGSARCGGDAQQQLATYIVQSDASGTVNFSLKVPAPAYSPLYINATEESYTAGSPDTSEISNSKRVAVSDDFFSDGFDCY